MSTPQTSRADDELRAKIRTAENALRLVWVIAFGAIVFSMLTVTPLVQRVTPEQWGWTAPLLPLVVDAAVIIVVRMDATISSFNARSGFWPAILRWMTGLFTLALNIGDSALKGDLVGVGVHAVCPALLIATSEAIPWYRRTIAAAVDQIRREQADERARREQQREDRERRAREEREQEQARREQSEREHREHQERLAREQADRAERQAREQREHEARLAREEREALAQQAREQAEREQAAKDAEQERQSRIRLAEIAAQQQRERLKAEEGQRREQATAAVREQVREARERRREPVREHPGPKTSTVHEKRPLHAVNTPDRATVNTRKPAATNSDKVDEDVALKAIRDAVNANKASIRGLARDTGWSVGWVSARVDELRGNTRTEDTAPTSHEDEQVSA